MAETIDLKLHVWRQNGPKDAGRFEDYSQYARGISTHASFLEFLDVVNERLVLDNKEPIMFDHDCREGICGMCGMVVNGEPHGPQKATTTCQLHMRSFRSGEELWVEPWRASAFPVIRDLSVDRGAFERIIQAGGYITARSGAAPDANAIPIAKSLADEAMDAATCIGCGACVAACPNASASLFMSAKIGHLNSLPQGQAERDKRTLAMVAQHEKEGFGSCSNHYLCEAACPKEISIRWIARMNRDLLSAAISYKPAEQRAGGDGLSWV
ncbi:MAG: succinate dehydrogenase/fumarate reductase iron-sulfur subunit [Polyangiaceae bacterium]|nr:succinate dehydrogenase/fumarate reductase iron-sulfur subunit [Polyangiaceae bacterium]